MILSLALPNIIGMFFLASKVKSLTKDYISKLEKGEFAVADDPSEADESG